MMIVGESVFFFRKKEEENKILSLNRSVGTKMKLDELLALCSRVAEYIEAHDGIVEDESELIAALEACEPRRLATIDADGDGDVATCFDAASSVHYAYLAGLVANSERVYFERAVALLDVLIGDIDDDVDNDDDDDATAAAAAADDDEQLDQLRSLRADLIAQRLQSEVPHIDGLVEEGCAAQKESQTRKTTHQSLLHWLVK